MIYTITHDAPGRLRVRVGQWVITKDEAAGLANHLRKLEGVTDAQVRSANGSILICYKRGHRHTAIEALDAIDVRALPGEADNTVPDMDALTNKFQMDLITTTLIHYGKKLLLPGKIRAVLTIIQAAPFIYRGIKALLNRKITVEVLDGVAIGTSILRGSYSTAGSVMFLLGVSDILAEYTQSRTRCALRQNMMFYAESVWLVQDGQDVLVSLEDVAIGDLIRVRTGQAIPIDGEIVEGEASINEASMTGESTLVPKSVGDSVFAGTALDDGELVIRTTALAGQSRIDAIVDMVENSEDAKALIASKAETLANSLVPVSLGIFLADLAFTRSLARASSVLMVDYSCAIKLSTPIAVMSAMREATKRGVVVKGGKYLEQLAKADTVVFDKTGTLTTAEPTCEKVLTFGQMSPNAVLRLAACLEEHFPHSMARAIVKSARDKGLMHQREMHADVEYIVAHGIASSVDGHKVRLGSAHFIFEDEHVPMPDSLNERIDVEAPTASVIYMAIDGVLEGALCIADQLRPEAPEIIKGLRERGFRHIVMLTGDSENCARAVSRELGIDEYHAQVLPEHKARYVEDLKRRGHTVMMVGDGINDSPALAAANISVAMSDASDIARTVADVTITHPSLEMLLTTKDLAVKLMRRIEHDYGFIAIFNTGLIALGLAGILAPAMTAALHNASTVAIAASNMRTLLPEPKSEDTAENFIAAAEQDAKAAPANDSAAESNGDVQDAKFDVYATVS